MSHARLIRRENVASELHATNKLRKSLVPMLSVLVSLRKAIAPLSRNFEKRCKFVYFKCEVSYSRVKIIFIYLCISFQSNVREVPSEVMKQL